MLRQHGDILRALAERRQRDRNDVQPVVEIFPKDAFRNGLLEVLVRRRNHPHINFHILRPSDAPKLPLLQDSQQLDLGGRRRFPDFVEKDTASVGHFEQTGLVRRRAGERALHITEQFAFQERLRQGAAIHRHKRHPGPRAAGMNRPGDEFLAGSALPANQHVALGISHLLDNVEHLLHGIAFTDQSGLQRLLRHFTLQQHVFRGEPAFFQRVPDDELDLIDLERLREIIVGAQLHRFHRRFRRRKGRDEEHDGIGRRVLHRLEDIQPAYFRHLEIGDHQVEQLLFNPRDGLVSV